MLLSPRAGHAERVISCCLCTVEGASGVQRQMNQLMEVAACCSHPVRVLRDWKLHGAQLRGASASGWTSLSKACAVVTAVALHRKEDPSHRILGGTRHPVPLSRPKVIKQSAGQGRQARGQRQLLPVRSAPLHLSETGRRGGKEGGGGFLGIGGSILHQLTQVKATTDVGGTSRAGGGRCSARTSHSGGLVCHTQLFGWTCLSRSY